MIIGMCFYVKWKSLRHLFDKNQNLENCLCHGKKLNKKDKKCAKFFSIVKLYKNHYIWILCEKTVTIDSMNLKIRNYFYMYAKEFTAKIFSMSQIFS